MPRFFAPFLVAPVAFALAAAAPASFATLEQDKLTVYGEANTPPSLDNPEFVPLDFAGFVGGLEPVIAVTLSGVVKVYPVRILAYHGVVNDTIGEIPVAVTYCGPCAGATVVKRTAPLGPVEIEAAGAIYDGSLLLSDRATGTLWRQRDGQALAGPHQGHALEVLSARIISMARFRQEHADKGHALVLRDSDLSRVKGDTRLNLPTPKTGDIKKEELAREDVRILGDQAWSLELLAQDKAFEDRDVIILWQPDSTFSTKPDKMPN
ncbi:MAG: DUF3179 domain-containing (seleno)protein [Pseudomonadota bacterium]